MSDGDHTGIWFMAIGQNTMSVGVSSSCQTVPRGSADGRLIEAVLESNAPGCQSIQIRRMRQGIPETAKRVESVVVTHNDKNIHNKFLLKIIFVFYQLLQEICRTRHPFPKIL